jgi:hypothetical protein
VPEPYHLHGPSQWVRAAMFYDYRFHEDEPLFVSAAATADLRFQAQGSSLFAQSAGSPTYRHQIWFCEATRREPGGNKRANYFVSVELH